MKLLRCLALMAAFTACKSKDSEPTAAVKTTAVEQIEKVQRPPTPAVEAIAENPEAGAIIESAWTRMGKATTGCPDDTDYHPQGGLRSFWCHASNVLSYDALAGVFGASVFVSGPHTSGLKLDDEKAFGHYNPKFVKALVKLAVPAAGNSAFKEATQDTYDDEVAPLARIYLFALQTLKSNPQLLAKQKQAYADIAAGKKVERPDWALAAFSPDTMFNRFGPAAAFWVRRDIDGTRDEFERGLRTLMRTYDREEYQRISQLKLPVIEGDGEGEMDAEGISGQPQNAENEGFGPSEVGDKDPRSLAALVDDAWKSIGKVKVETACPNQFEYEPGGARVAYCAIAGAVNFAQLQDKFVKLIFVSGPHTRTSLNVNSEEAFGHYNPEFVKWLADKAVPGATRASFVTVTRAAYNKKIRIPARMFLIAKRIMDADSDILKIQKGELQHYMKTKEGGPIHPKQEELFPEMKYYEPTAIGATGVAFWVRRNIDGTDKDFEKALRVLLKAYDGEFLKQLDAVKGPELQSEIPKLINPILN